LGELPFEWCGDLLVVNNTNNTATANVDGATTTLTQLSSATTCPTAKPALSVPGLVVMRDFGVCQQYSDLF
jgi:hypothetical protein